MYLGTLQYVQGRARGYHAGLVRDPIARAVRKEPLNQGSQVPGSHQVCSLIGLPGPLGEALSALEFMPKETTSSRNHILCTQGMQWRPWTPMDSRRQVHPHSMCVRGRHKTGGGPSISTARVGT